MGHFESVEETTSSVPLMLTPPVSLFTPAETPTRIAVQWAGPSSGQRLSRPERMTRDEGSVTREGNAWVVVLSDVVLESGPWMGGRDNASIFSAP